MSPSVCHVFVAVLLLMALIQTLLLRDADGNTAQIFGRPPGLSPPVAS